MVRSLEFTAAPSSPRCCSATPVLLCAAVNASSALNHVLKYGTLRVTLRRYVRSAAPILLPNRS